MKAFAIFAVLAVSLVPGIVRGADASKGQAIFQQQCGICHKAGTNVLGPDLKGIHGSKAGAFSGFNFSAAMKQAGAKGLLWDDENLDKFLQNPQGLVPGTTMAYLGLSNKNEREDIIAYLKTLKS